MDESTDAEKLQETVTRLQIENSQLSSRLSALEEEQQIFRFIFESSPDALAYLDRELRFRVCNSTEANLEGDLSGRHLGEIIGAKRLHQIQPHIDRVLAGEEVVFEEYSDQAPGQAQYVEVYYLPHLGVDGNTMGFCRMTRTIDTQPPPEGSTRPPANHDYLTELPNRILFQDRLNQAIYRAIRGKSKIALLLIGLGAPRPLNRREKDETGDDLRRIIASRLHHCVRRSDTLARINPDEFVALVENMGNRRSLQKLAQKLIDTLGKPVRTAGENTGIRVSIGISIYPEHGADSSTLISRAVDALNQARTEASGSYMIYDPN